MSNIELIENEVYDNQKLAEWFGIQPETMRKLKRKKLKELEEYAEFIAERGKVTITKVKEPMYHKNLNNIKKFVSEHFLETWDTEGLETCSRVAAKLCLIYREVTGVSEINSKESSFLYCVRQERDKHFPIRQKEWGKMYGKIGKENTSTETRAKNIYERLSAAEQEEFVTEFYNRYKRNNVVAAILDMNKKYERGELSSDKNKWEEAWKDFCNTTGANERPFTTFLGDMANKFESDWMISGTDTKKSAAEIAYMFN